MGVIFRILFGSRFGCVLGAIFDGLLVDFGGQVGAKLGSKIDQKSIETRADFEHLISSISWGLLGAEAVCNATRGPALNGPGEGKEGGVLDLFLSF